MQIVCYQNQIYQSQCDSVHLEAVDPGILTKLTLQICHNENLILKIHCNSVHFDPVESGNSTQVMIQINRNQNQTKVHCDCLFLLCSLEDAEHDALAILTYKHRRVMLTLNGYKNTNHHSTSEISNCDVPVNVFLDGLRARILF